MKENQPPTEAEKSAKAPVETICFSAQEAEAWDVPGFQREVRVNKVVEALVKVIGHNGGIIPGILTFAVVKALGNKRFLIDGLQRRQAFLISGKKEGFADIRTVFCDTLAEAANEFLALNSVRADIKPEDLLPAKKSPNP